MKNTIKTLKMKAIIYLAMVLLMSYSCTKQEENDSQVYSVSVESVNNGDSGSRDYIYKCKYCGARVILEEKRNRSFGNFYLFWERGANDNGGTQPLANTTMNLVNAAGENVSTGVTDSDGYILMEIPFEEDANGEPIHYDIQFSHAGTSYYIPHTDYHMHHDTITITVN